MASYWFRRYRLWVNENIDKLHITESILSKCIWLLPNRFSESEIGGEFCRTILGLVQLWHETLFDSNRQDSRSAWSIALEAIQKIEVLFEMRVTHLDLLGQCNKYTPLAVLESIKLIVRLFLLNTSRSLVETSISSEEAPKGRRNGYQIIKAFRSLASSTISGVNEGWYTASERWDSTMTPTASSTSSSIIGEDPMKQQNEVPPSSRSADTAMGITSDLQYSLWWNQPSLMEPMLDTTEDSSGPSPTQEPSLGSDSSEFSFRIGRWMILFGEILHLVRPLLSVLCRRQFGSDSWKPWLISLGLDTASQTLLSKGSELMQYAGIHSSDDLPLKDQLLVYLTMMRNFQWTPVEEQELKRRKTVFLLYLMRSPVFEVVTKPGLNAAERCLRVVPVLGKVLSKGLELVYGAQRYHVYTDGQY